MNELRPCTVNGTPALFHLWTDRIIYDENGCSRIFTVGIVEYLDGHMEEVDLSSVFFVAQ